MPVSPRLRALAELRSALAPMREAAACPAPLASGLTALDALLGGGMPRGAVLTLEGQGNSSLLARCLAAATAKGVAALIEIPKSPQGRVDPASLAAAGVDLDRLLVVHAHDGAAVARAADIIMRGAAFTVIAIPIVAMRPQVWTKLASLAHRHNGILIAGGESAGSELRFAATIRLEVMLRHVSWNGASGLFASLHSTEITARVAKHKLAAPGKSADITCDYAGSSGISHCEAHHRRALIPLQIGRRQLPTA